MYSPCYTCRRRHIECDRTRIPCAKCEKAGLECSKKRPIRWVKGMCIRGKMQGLSVEDASVAAANFNGTSARTKCNSVKSSVKRLKLPIMNNSKYNGKKSVIL
jgi:hypothetical protein